MHLILVNCLGGLCLPKNSTVRLTDHLHMTIVVYHGRKTLFRLCPNFQNFYSICQSNMCAPNISELTWSSGFLHHVRRPLLHDLLKLHFVAIYVTCSETKCKVMGFRISEKC